ncbi:acid protease [Phanerochaete sordida]|uniref:Acid protease n=1 Tax=Phanerochaete sordida TaxID=48140 RepID=A0A9P3GGE6_9APHY|nr:acid protease [Phanerochaete sordida]
MPVTFRTVAVLLLSTCAAFAALSLERRDAPASEIPFQKTSAVNITDDSYLDYFYLVNITLGGREFTVELDTGSSDFWLYAPELQVANDSGLTANITYLDRRSASGPIQFAELQIGEYTVPSQAFINTRSLAGWPVDRSGLLGVSFSTDNLSRIERTIHRAWGKSSTLGRSVMANIFAQNASMEASYDLTLGRKVDDEESSSAGGTFIIGYHDPRYSNITQAPQIPKVVADEWAGYLDGMTVNGENIPLPASHIAHTPPGKLVALFDSGTSNVLVPPSLADAVYSQIAGSIKVGDSWLIPCYSAANVTFVIGGMTYPVHPLDISRVYPTWGLLSDGTNATYVVCEGSISTLQADDVDVILGDVFLKNTYTSFNFGSANRDQTPSGANGSFVQLLSTTDADDAWIDFHLTRGATLSEKYPISIDPAFLPALFPRVYSSQNATGTGALTPIAVRVSRALEATCTDRATTLLSTYGPVAIGLLAANLAIMLLLCIIALVACTRRRTQERTVSATYNPVAFSNKQGSEHDLHDDMPAVIYNDQY